MELRPFLLFLSTFYFISCANSASIYNDELSKGEYGSRVLSRALRSPNGIWDLRNEKNSFRQKKDLSEEQQTELRHENVIYITLADSSEKSKEPYQDRHEPFNLWDIIGKTTEFLTMPFVKTFIPRMYPDYPDNFGAVSRLNLDPPPFYNGP